MKKGFLLAMGFLAFQAVSAQEATVNGEGTTSYKPTKGTITTEAILTGGLLNSDFDLQGGALKFRYFLKEDLALRASLGLDSSKDVDNYYYSSTNNGSETEKNSNTTIKLGAEKHFAGTNRLSTYAGAELILGFGKYSYEDDYVSGFYEESQKNSGFGIGVFTGADYYIAPKIYLGIEVGLSFMSQTEKELEWSSDSSSGTDENTGGKGSELSTQVNGGLRIGFQF